MGGGVLGVEVRNGVRRTVGASHPWRYSGDLWMWHRGTRLVGGRGLELVILKVILVIFSQPRWI